MPPSKDGGDGMHHQLPAPPQRHGRTALGTAVSVRVDHGAAQEPRVHQCSDRRGCVVRLSLNLTRPVKKSELLRAGIAALHAMADKAFLAALNGVPSLKTGRPKSSPDAVSTADKATK